MKIEVGMYVRFLNGTIAKCININGNSYRFDNELDSYGTTTITKEDVNSEYLLDDVKLSFDIINLIEEGDYVNGMEVTRISGTRYDDNDLHCYCEHNGNENWKQVMIPAKNIKTIVTKEQFGAGAYKVGE